MLPKLLEFSGKMRGNLSVFAQKRNLEAGYGREMGNSEENEYGYAQKKNERPDENIQISQT